MRYVYVLLVILGLILVYLSTTTSEEFDRSKWYSFEEDARISKNTGKKIFLFVSSPTCSVCSYFKSKVFSDSSVMEYISANFVPAYVDIGERKPPVKVYAFPTFCVGYPTNFTCFYASTKTELLNNLKKFAQ